MLTMYQASWVRRGKGFQSLTIKNFGRFEVEFYVKLQGSFCEVFGAVCEGRIVVQFVLKGET